MTGAFLNIHTCQAVDLGNIPILESGDFRSAVLNEMTKGARVVSFWGCPKNGQETELYIVLAYDNKGIMAVSSTVVNGAFRSLTPDIPQCHMFEREIFEQCGIRPEGHPWLKPVRKDSGGAGFFKVSGEEVHEVAVGPVHAGIIEPGHFRFQCHGEHVFHLEISLGYQHRGVEKALIGGPDKRTVHYMETLAGDTSIGHALAYCHAAESLSGIEVSVRAMAIRGILLELERLANHTGDLGALANDIGYLPTSSYCGRLRGDFLNMTAFICGNRFGRNAITPGGVMFDIDDAIIAELKIRLDKTYKDVQNAVSLLWESAPVVDRFEETGVLTGKNAVELGLVGVAARACGIERDVRFDFPSGIFQFSQIPPATYSSGDVFARAFVRWLEIQRSVEFIKGQLNSMPAGAPYSDHKALRGRKLAVSLTEGWRGEICHAVITDDNGKFRSYKITDPSFHNWFGLAVALRGEEISNFPLCNKSFNLSYCGNDL